MNNDKETLGSALIGKLLLKLAIPTVVAQFINRRSYIYYAGK